MHDDEHSLRSQLVAARAAIVTQLEELHFRTTALGFSRRGGPPDYRAVIAELEDQLREIDTILGAPDGADD